MKADLTRTTDQPDQHYRAVRMQQGRVQLDAEWNEQQAILNRRIETETVDTIGIVGGPIEGAGFQLTGNGQNIEIGTGHYYVNGLLCQNEAALTATSQPHLPGAVSPLLVAPAKMLSLAPAGAAPLTQLRVYAGDGSLALPQNGIYIGYLEAWLRHVTALEDPYIREVALGGPDTTSRDQLVWQVKLLRAGDLGSGLDCLSDVAAWNSLTAEPTGKMAARAEPSTPPKDPCLLAPEAGYRRLENQLYRVEIHDDGSLSGKVLYKWSRDNGAIVSRVTRMPDPAPANEFEVASIGRDGVLAITSGCWLEFFDDSHELLGRPGTLVQVIRTQGNVVTLDLATKTGSLDAALFASNPRVRRWDGWDEMDPEPVNGAYGAGWVALEDGITIKFHNGSYRVGDYWTFAARTATATVEWPQTNDAKAQFLAPEGVLRVFTRLAMVQCDNGNWTTLSDCRTLFPALGALTNLYYVGGDGQEVAPNPLAPVPVALPSPLQVAVFNGQYPVAGAHLRYSASHGLLKGAGGTAVIQTLDGGRTLVVASRSDGSAAVQWQLAPTVVNQQCTVELLIGGVPVAGRFNDIRFAARLAMAAEVAYDPEKVPDLKALGVNNVQDAIDALGQRHSGGGCCVIVGPGGEFTHLDLALTTLVEKGERDICICMLPGDHELLDGIDLGLKGLKLAIHGSGAASRLHLKDKEFNLFDCDAVLVRDLVILGAGDEQVVRFQDCLQLTLEGVDITGPALPGNSLVQISGCRRLRLSGCDIVAFQPASLDFGRDLVAKVPLLAPMSRMVSGRSGELVRVPQETIKAFAAYSPAQGKELVGQIKALTDSTAEPLSPAAREGLVAVAEAVGRGRDSRAIREALATLVTAVVASQPGAALMLADPHAELLLSDSQIGGRLSLYGEATDEAADDGALRKKLGAMMREGKATLQRGRGRLHLHNCLLREMLVSDAMVAALKSLAASDGGTLSEPCLRNLQIESCAIVGRESLWVAINFGLNGNELRPRNDVGTLYAANSKCIGNFADNDFRLFVVGHLTQEVANGALNIVQS